MLNNIKNLFTKQELLNGNFGIEREGLRVDKNGVLSEKPHPVSYTHLTLPTNVSMCRSRWSPYH